MKNHEENSKITHMTSDEAMKLLASIDPSTLPKDTAMLLSEIVPITNWQMLTQGQKGVVGHEFYQYRTQLGFEYAGKGMSGTTNLYRLIADKSDEEV